MRELPSGTVTFLFTDIEGSTGLLRRLRDRYGDALADHARLLRAAFAEPEAFARLQRERLRKAYGVEPEDELEVLVAGCRSVGGFGP